MKNQVISNRSNSTFTATTQFLNMKKLLALFFCSVFSLAVHAQKADDIVGTWLTGTGKARVLIFKVDNSYFGMIVWLRDPLNEEGKPKMDKNNPDPKKKTAPLIGLQMLKAFTFDGSQWENGTIYDPENGKTYSCTINMKDGKLDVRGYIGISLIGRTQVWTRVSTAK